MGNLSQLMEKQMYIDQIFCNTGKIEKILGILLRSHKNLQANQLYHGKTSLILTQNETVISQKSEQRYIKCQYSHVKQNCKCLVKCLKLSVLMFFVDHQHRKSSDVICVIGSLLSGHDFNSVKDKVWGRIKTFNCSIHQPEQKYR